MALRIFRASALSVAVGVALWLSAQSSYLLFHSLSEVFSIAVAAAVFMISWSSRGYLEAKPFVLLGIGYLCVAVIDLFHLLSFQGMSVLANTRDDATRLWVAARGLQALVTLVFVLQARTRRTFPPVLAFAVIGSLTAAALLSVFWWDVFPICFVQGAGVTPFKRASEYVISAIFAVSIALLARGPDSLTRQERLLLCTSFALTIASELVFTLYVSAYGVQNLIGHYLKIAAFFLAYQALFAGKIRGQPGPGG